MIDPSNKEPSTKLDPLVTLNSLYTSGVIKPVFTNNVTNDGFKATLQIGDKFYQDTQAFTRKRDAERHVAKMYFASLSSTSTEVNLPLPPSTHPRLSPPTPTTSIVNVPLSPPKIEPLFPPSVANELLPPPSRGDSNIPLDVSKVFNSKLAIPAAEFLKMQTCSFKKFTLLFIDIENIGDVSFFTRTVITNGAVIGVRGKLYPNAGKMPFPVYVAGPGKDSADMMICMMAVVVMQKAWEMKVRDIDVLIFSKDHCFVEMINDLRPEYNPFEFNEIPELIVNLAELQKKFI